MHSMLIEAGRRCGSLERLTSGSIEVDTEGLSPNDLRVQRSAGSQARITSSAAELSQSCTKNRSIIFGRTVEKEGSKAKQWVSM
jgi:hypothetical protein